MSFFNMVTRRFKKLLAWIVVFVLFTLILVGVAAVMGVQL